MRTLSGDGESDPNSPAEFEDDHPNQCNGQAMDTNDIGPETAKDSVTTNFHESVTTKTKEEILASRMKKANRPIPGGLLENGVGMHTRLKPAGGRRSRIPDPSQNKVPTDSSRNDTLPIANSHQPVSNDIKQSNSQTSQVKPTMPKGVPMNSSPKKVLMPLGRGAGALRQMMSKQTAAIELSRQPSASVNAPSIVLDGTLSDRNVSNDGNVPRLQMMPGLPETATLMKNEMVPTGVF